MILVFSRQSTQQITSSLLIIWLSGVLFLLCCGEMQAQASEKEFCPLAAKAQSHCDKSKTKNDLPTITKESGGQTLDCCGFLPAVFDKTRKIEETQQTAQPIDKIKVDLPTFSFAGNDFQTIADYRSPVINQNKIFIKNCIFRI